MTGIAIRPEPGPEAASGLDFLTELLTGDEARQDWLARCDSEVSPLFTEATLLIGALQTESAWQVDLLLDELRCRKRTRAQLRDLRPAHLMECIDFIGWIKRLVALAPADQRVKRELISGLSKMYADAGKDLDACERVMVAAVEGDTVTPADLVAIGEIGTALQAARCALPGAAGDAERRLRDENPFGAMPLGHIRPVTLDALLRYSNGSGAINLGAERAIALLTHVSECRRCDETYRERADTLGLQPAWMVSVASRSGGVAPGDELDTW